MTCYRKFQYTFNYNQITKRSKRVRQITFYFQNLDVIYFYQHLDVIYILIGKF